MTLEKELQNKAKSAPPAYNTHENRLVHLEASQIQLEVELRNIQQSVTYGRIAGSFAGMRM